MLIGFPFTNTENELYPADLTRVTEWLEEVSNSFTIIHKPLNIPAKWTEVLTSAEIEIQERYNVPPAQVYQPLGSPSHCARGDGREDNDTKCINVKFYVVQFV